MTTWSKLSIDQQRSPCWPYEIVHDRVLAYGWRRYVRTKGPLRAAAASRSSWMAREQSRSVVGPTSTDSLTRSDFAEAYPGERSLQDGLLEATGRATVAGAGHREAPGPELGLQPLVGYPPE